MDTVDCTFTNTLQKENPSASTDPSVIPNDDATISGLGAGGAVDGAFDKELHFQLFTGVDCGGTKVFEETVTVTANGVYSTDNDGEGADGFTIDTDGTWYWKVVYDGDSRNNPFALCDESVQVDLEASS